MAKSDAGRIPCCQNSIQTAAAPKRDTPTQESHNRSDYIRIFGPAVASGLSMLVGGCSGSEPPTALAVRPDAAVRSVQGDWDDADAAVYGGLDSTGAAVTRVYAVSPTRREYRLRCMSGEDGVLVIQKPQASSDEPARLEVRCSIGRLGDPEREEVIVKAVTRRIRELCGVEYAPRK